MRETLDAGLPALGLDLPEDVRQTLCDFGAAVIKQNEVMNSPPPICGGKKSSTWAAARDFPVCRWPLPVRRRR